MRPSFARSSAESRAPLTTSASPSNEMASFAGLPPRVSTRRSTRSRADQRNGASRYQPCDTTVESKLNLGGTGRRVMRVLEATAGIEPANKGFADLCLTTWLRRPEVVRVGESSERPKRRQYSA